MTFADSALHRIRNFSIIAHIDHGKSTLADRLLEETKTVTLRQMQDQILDDMDLERERGITIKAHPVSMVYLDGEGISYQLNLIDTPGHVDFSYEVSRSLAACEGALLVVDAVQGIQAQTLANVHLALERNIEILPVINKIDLAAADVQSVKHQLEDILAIDASEAICCSAKKGEGIAELLSAIVKKIPPPAPPEDDRLRALIFDSHYDPYKGVMAYVRVVSGQLTPGNSICLMGTGKTFELAEVGIFCPHQLQKEQLCAGEVGYISASIKRISEVRVGDTITSSQHPASEPLVGFKLIQPVVFAGIYPVDAVDFESLRDALDKLKLNDSALQVEIESSSALGMGFRCGFLGLLHLEVIFERIQREFDLDIISTAPGVTYRFTLSDQSHVLIDNPARYPNPAHIDQIEEPWVRCHVFAPAEYLGAIMHLAAEKRGEMIKTETVDALRLMLTYLLPLNEIVSDFNDRLKSTTRGYASFDCEPDGYRRSDIVKLEIRVNEEPVDAFSCLVHRSKAEGRGRALCLKLLDVIPQHLFKIPIQAAVGGKIMARETIKALSKDVTAKCYGGDITRKRKLWEKQKAGKKRMKEVGRVSIPQGAFMEVLRAFE